MCRPFRPQISSSIDSGPSRARQGMCRTSGALLTDMVSKPVHWVPFKPVHWVPLQSNDIHCLPVQSNAPFLSNAFLCCPMLSFAVHCFPLLFNAVHCIPLLFNALHWNPFLATCINLCKNRGKRRVVIDVVGKSVGKGGAKNHGSDGASPSRSESIRTVVRNRRCRGLLVLLLEPAPI